MSVPLLLLFAALPSASAAAAAVVAPRDGHDGAAACESDAAVAMAGPAAGTSLAPGDDKVSWLQASVQLRHARAARSSAAAAKARAPQVPTQLLLSALPLAWLHIPETSPTLANTLLHLPALCPGVDHDAYLDAGVMLDDLVGGTPSSELLETACPGAFAPYGPLVGDHDGVGSIYESVVKGHGLMMLRLPETTILASWYDSYHSWPVEIAPSPKSMAQFAEVLSGCMTRMLTRDGKACGDVLPPTGQEVIEAKARLNDGFVFVGLVEHWDLSVCLMHAMFGGSCQDNEFIVLQGWSYADNVTYNESELGGYKDPYDGPLYHAGEERFLANLRTYGVSETSCQPCFERR